VRPSADRAAPFPTWSTRAYTVKQASRLPTYGSHVAILRTE
jgi:hypothetical protein